MTLDVFRDGKMYALTTNGCEKLLSRVKYVQNFTLYLFFKNCIVATFTESAPRQIQSVSCHLWLPIAWCNYLLEKDGDFQSKVCFLNIQLRINFFCIFLNSNFHH